ncbi:MAG: hypothetical protein K1X71_01865 [Pirellulales bacterium]|jgi:hypothetical protein|nr:hypothetical protein [Pirellulales bacterium]
MWRSFFLAVGIYACILGVECLLIDKAILAPRGGAAGVPAVREEFMPPDWVSWSLLSAGAVTILYSFTLPQRARG